MVGPALRSYAVAGVLALTLVFGGVATAAPILAEPGEPDGSSQDSGEPGDPGGESEEPGRDEAVPDAHEEPEEPEAPPEAPAEEPDEPEVIHNSDPEPEDNGGDSGGGGGDVGGRDEPAAEPPPPPPAPAPRYQHSITIPWFRLPAAGEIPPGTWPKVSTFYTTIAIPVPTLEEFLRALRVVPAPRPVPGPAFRTQEEAPVADAGTGTTTGGGGGGGPMAEPMVFRAPLVTVPRSTTVAGRPTKIPPRVPAGAAAPPGVTQPGVAGVRTPAIRGSVPPTPGATAAPVPASPASGQAPRVGAYSRGMTNPTLAEIAAVALPGVAGLLFLTFSGGMIGYRQANSSRFVRTAGAERFLP